MNAQTTQAITDLAMVGSHKVEMMFYPVAWKAAAAISPTWHSIPFPPKQKKDIPKQPGVYVFVVTPNVFSLEPTSGLFYVGKATSLYARMGAYIGEIDKDHKVSPRPMVWRMINQWNGHLRLYYTITADVNEAEDLENEMLNALRPPFNKEYEAEVSQVMRAL